MGELVDMKKAVLRRVINSADGVRGPDTVFVVDLFSDEEFVGTVDTRKKSLFYVDDVIENWENGILKEDNEHIIKDKSV